MDNVILLGTSSAFPTKERNHPSIYINLNGKIILLDCGEGTQRQIRIAGLSPSIDKIFITHWHGDHSLGVGGIIQSINMSNASKLIEIFGPKGTKSSVKNILSAYKFYSRVHIKTRVIDAKREKLIDRIGKFSLYAINVKHGVPCLGYKIKEDDSINIRREMLEKFRIKPGKYLNELKQGKDVEYNGKVLKASNFTYIKKGKKIVYLTDLKYEKRLSRFAKDADLLIIEATLSSKFEKKAREIYHLTIADALRIGKEANVKKLVVVHTSQRYEDTNIIEQEAKVLKDKMKLNFNIIIGRDLMRLSP